MSFLLALFPLKTLLGLAGLGGLAAFFSIKGKVQEVQADNKRVQISNAVVENHTVEQKQASAQTPEDVYAALEADRKSDHS